MGADLVPERKFLSFVRNYDTDRTNFHTQNEKTAVTLETDSGEGDTGTVINGLTKVNLHEWKLAKRANLHSHRVPPRNGASKLSVVKRMPLGMSQRVSLAETSIAKEGGI